GELAPKELLEAYVKRWLKTSTLELEILDE
mgnify:CR=1